MKISRYPAIRTPSRKVYSNPYPQNMTAAADGPDQPFLSKRLRKKTNDANHWGAWVAISHFFSAPPVVQELQKEIHDANT